MMPSTKATIRALASRPLTRREIERKTNYAERTIMRSLAVLVARKQVAVVDPDARVPVYQLTGDICECCGQVIR